MSDQPKEGFGVTTSEVSYLEKAKTGEDPHLNESKPPLYKGKNPNGSFHNHHDFPPSIAINRIVIIIAER